MRDLARGGDPECRFLTGTLDSRLLQGSCTEVSCTVMLDVDLLRGSCTEILCRDLVYRSSTKRSCAEILCRGLVMFSFEMLRASCSTMFEARFESVRALPVSELVRWTNPGYLFEFPGF